MTSLVRATLARHARHRALAVAATLAVAVVWCEGLGAQAEVATATNLRCSFSRSASGAWKKDGSPEASVKPGSLVLRFEAIDTESGTALLRNGSMTTEVTARLAEGYLHLMQAFRTGPLYTTTVFSAGASGGKLKAVHSRHELFSVPLPGATSTPEQYYGECEAGR
jgi:hypothetical protein